MVKSNPRVWQISKVNRSNVKGIAVFTCAQDLENPHTVKADYDEEGNVIAWWADWNTTALPPQEAISNEDATPFIMQPDTVTSTITCSGKPQIKIGGSAKTFTVNLHDINGEDVPDYPVGDWAFYIDDSDISELIEVIPTDLPQKIKVKFLGDDTYIGKVVTIVNSFEDVTASLQIELCAL